MPTPKRKLSRSRRDKRSANKGLKPKAIASCQTCQAPIATHKICAECGYYKGVKILRTKADRKYQRAHTRDAVQAKVQARQASEAGSGDTSAAS
jgi:large subunit ribosomal protein L32